MPPIPTWTGLHPLIIHFPIALLFVAPLFVVVATVWRRPGPGWSLAALVLMGLGTLSLFVAVATGEAAGQVVDRTPQITASLQRHESLAETGQVIFSLLTLAYATFVLVPLVLKRELKVWTRQAFTVLFLLVYLGGMSHLARVAHEGGRLVHEFGVRSIVAATPSSDGPLPASPTAGPHEEDRD